MEVRGRGRVEQVKQKHADARAALNLWSSRVRNARWHTPADILGVFPTASIIPGTNGRRVVFDIRRHYYRLDAKIDYERGVVLVKRIGTHREYDNWDFDA